MVALLIRVYSLPWPGISLWAWQHRRLLPLGAGKASCSLPDIIWRLSLGSDAWCISHVTLDTVPCKHSCPVVQMMIRWHSLAIVIRLCWYESSYMVEACHFMQIRWSPSYFPNPTYPLYSGIQLSCLTESVSWKATPTMFTGWTWPFLQLLPPIPHHDQMANGPWGVGGTIRRKIQKYFNRPYIDYLLLE